jgi:hypothetical protein
MVEPKDKSEDTKVCPACNGNKQFVQYLLIDGCTGIPNYIPCYKCKGTGVVKNKEWEK